MSALTAPIQVDGCNLKPAPHPFPSPAGRGVLKPFSLREKGGDEGSIRLLNEDYENLT